jgi:hypothetical protein
MVYYGLHTAAIDETIIDANPVFLIGSSPIGPMAGTADINKFTAAGIKYFEYLTGGYETKYPKGLPVDLQSNLDFIEAVAVAGAYGIFFDEVSDGVWTTADYSYLQQISSKARSLGLKIIFNTGVNNWVDQLMDYCDYIGSTEQWTNAPLTASQQKWSNRLLLLRREGINDAVTAANLTIGAWDKGVLSAYATSSLMALPSWLPTYISLILPYSPDPANPPPPSEMPPGNTSAVVASYPVSTGKINEYNLDIIITSTTVPGLSGGQIIPVTAMTTDFPNLLVFNSDVTGDLDNSLGWWTLKSGVVSPPPPSSITANLSVVLQGGSRTDAGYAIPLTVKFFTPGANVLTESPLFQSTVTTTKSDTTAIAQVTGVPAGNYDVTVVSAHTLVNVKLNVSIASPGITLNMGILLEGNANDDNIINMLDFSTLATSFGTSSGVAGYDPRADFDRNGQVNMLDFSLLASNYSKTAPVIIP